MDIAFILDYLKKYCVLDIFNVYNIWYCTTDSALAGMVILDIWF